MKKKIYVFIMLSVLMFSNVAYGLVDGYVTYEDLKNWDFGQGTVFKNYVAIQSYISGQSYVTVLHSNQDLYPYVLVDSSDNIRTVKLYDKLNNSFTDLTGYISFMLASESEYSTKKLVHAGGFNADDIQVNPYKEISSYDDNLILDSGQQIPRILYTLSESEKLAELSSFNFGFELPGIFLNEGTTYRFKGSDFNFKMMANVDGYFTYNLFYDDNGSVKHIESSMIQQMGEDEQSITFNADTELQIMIESVQNGSQVEVRTDAVMESMITDFGTLNVTPVIWTYTSLDSTNNHMTLYYDDYKDHVVKIRTNMLEQLSYAFFVMEENVNGNWVKLYSSTVFNDNKDHTLILKPDQRVSVFQYGEETTTVKYVLLDSVISLGSYPIDIAESNGYINNPSLEIKPINDFEETDHNGDPVYVPDSYNTVDFGDGIDGIFNFFIWLKDTILGALLGTVNLFRDILNYIVLINSYIGDTAKIFADLFGSIPPILWAIVVVAIGVRFFFLVAGRN